MLSDYKGPANSSDIFQHLVGEKIVAAFSGDKGHVWIVTESGSAIVFGGGGDIGSPVFWKAIQEDVQRIVDDAQKSHVDYLS